MFLERNICGNNCNAIYIALFLRSFVIPSNKALISDDGDEKLSDITRFFL